MFYLADVEPLPALIQKLGGQTLTKVLGQGDTIFYKKTKV